MNIIEPNKEPATVASRISWDDRTYTKTLIADHTLDGASEVTLSVRVVMFTEDNAYPSVKFRVETRKLDAESGTHFDYDHSFTAMLAYNNMRGLTYVPEKAQPRVERPSVEEERAVEVSNDVAMRGEVTP